MKRLIWIRHLAAGLAMVVASAGLIGHAQPARADPVVFPPGSNPYGASYGEWSGRWWQWAAKGNTPQTNAVLDMTGTYCGVGQSGPVWFLAGRFDNGTVTRNCTVPAGKALFLPVVTAFDANDPGKHNTCDQEQANARKAMNGATGAARIDVTQMQDLEQHYRVISPCFRLVLKADNPLGPPGTYDPAAADCICLMVAPLPAGRHEIHFQGSGPLSLDVTYHLTVAPG